MHHRLDLFPVTTTLGQVDGVPLLEIVGLPLPALAQRYGTPLYLLDEATMDRSLAEYRDALASTYPAPCAITLAGKALLLTATAQWAARSGLWLDCTGAGELAIARHAGFPRGRIVVHGVNKSDEDLRAAVEYAGVVVVDNLSELGRLLALLAGRSEPAPALWLRVRPGVTVDTHAYRQTGQEESKFGMALHEAVDAIALCRAHDRLPEGIHFHQGSHFHDVAPIGPAIDRVLDLVEELAGSQGWTPQVLSPGGGWGVAYHEDDLPHPSIAEYVQFTARSVLEGCQRRNLPLPRLHLEPGRSLVARAGVALYRVGVVKRSGAKHWLLIDGGLADNPRPALYGARYSALPLTNPLRAPTHPVTIAGPYCESGDILIHDLPMADIAEGEWIAIPVSGAYHLNMGSNYNGARKPAVVWLESGQAHLVQRREAVEDLFARDLPLPHQPSDEELP
jgi:diaminopimelate decarboxylase